MLFRDAVPSRELESEGTFFWLDQPRMHGIHSMLGWALDLAPVSG